MDLLTSRPAEYEKQKGMNNEIFHNFQNRLDIKIAEQETDQKLKLLIRNCVTKLASFANDFNGFYERNFIYIDESLEDFKYLFYEIEGKLFDTYQYLRYSFSDCFNNELPIPKAFYGMIDYQVHPHLIGKLSEKQIDKALLQILNDFLDTPSTAQTYNIQTWLQLNYFERLNDALLSFANQAPSQNDTLMLIKVLVRKNFNHDAFYEYMIAYVEDLSTNDATYEEQEIDLYKFGDIIEQVRPIKNLGFNLEVLTIQESISVLVKSGKKRIRELNNNLVSNASEGVKKNQNFFSWRYFGPFTEIMFFLRIVVRMKIISIKSWSALYHVLSNQSSSVRSKSPSTGHLRNQNVKDEDVPPKVVKKVVETLKRILAYIEENFKSQLRFK